MKIKERLLLLWKRHRVAVIAVLTAAVIIAAAVTAVVLLRARGDGKSDTPSDDTMVETSDRHVGETESVTEVKTDCPSEAESEDGSSRIVGEEEESATAEVGGEPAPPTDSQRTQPNPDPQTQLPAQPEPGPEPEPPSKPQTAAPPAAETQPPAPAGREEILRSMTLREKVYQLFVVFPIQISGEKSVTVATDAMKSGLKDRPVGGVLYDASNMISKDQVARLLSDMQSGSAIPLLTSCDEEGGRVGRLMNTVGTTKLDPMMSYRDKGAAVATQNACTIATDMRSLGFNLDFAPVADVWSNPANKVIGDRAYSDDYGEAAELIAAAVRGFHQGGVACTLKHFPGHGDTAADTHTGAAYVTKTLDELRRGELLPFKAGIDAGADAVMIGHLTVTAVSGEPALFSREIVTDLLRGELGFSGVVITDGLRMGAVSSYSDGEIAVRAIKAGVDILLCPRDLDAAAEGLISAVRSGEISEVRIDESVRRILKLKGF